MEERSPHKESPPRPQNPEIRSKSTIPETKEASTKIHRLCQLLPQLYPAVVRNATRFLRTTASRQTNQSNRGITKQLQSDQGSASGSMRIGSQTTNHRTTKRPIDGCYYSRLGIRANDRRRERQRTQFQKKNLRSRSIRIESILTSTTEDVSLLQRLSGNLSRIVRIQPHLVGNNPTNSCND